LRPPSLQLPRWQTQRDKQTPCLQSTSNTPPSYALSQSLPGAILTPPHKSLIDEIINAVNTIIYHAIEAIENGLLSLPPPALGFGSDKSSTSLSIADADGDGNVEYPDATAEIENGVHQLETLLEATVDKTFDKFEIYTLRNILTVPDELAGWMRLGHYEVGSTFLFCIVFPVRKHSFVEYELLYRHSFHIRPQTSENWAISSPSNQGIRICLVCAPLKDAFVPSHLSLAKDLLCS